MSPFVAGLIAWITANPVTAIGIGLAIYAFLTKKITLDGLLDKLADILRKPTPVPPPVVGPVQPDVLQKLIDLLVSAHIKGDTETKEAVVKVLSASRGV